MFNIKTLAMATVVSAGVLFALPATSQAMPQSSPVTIGTAENGNIVDVRHRMRSKKWARYCRRNGDDPRCYRNHRAARLYRDRDYDLYNESNDGYYYRPRHRSGLGLQFNID